MIIVKYFQVELVRVKKHKFINNFAVVKINK